MLTLCTLMVGQVKNVYGREVAKHVVAAAVILGVIYHRVSYCRGKRDPTINVVDNR